MTKVGIITIHKIHNYGSVLQAFALQQACEKLGLQVEIIDYDFPNSFQANNSIRTDDDTQPNEPRWIKLLFGAALIRQHRGVDVFVKSRLRLSLDSYDSPEMLMNNPPLYDYYLTGSDQVWSPRHTNGDPAFLLHFAPENRPKIAYAASIGSNSIPSQLQKRYSRLLSRYQHIAVREESGCGIVKALTGNDVQTVLDPTLLLNKDDWDRIATPYRIIKKPYILCYFLNYSFNVFPYVDDLANNIQKQTGYQIVRVARPPHYFRVRNTKYQIGASPEEFLALIRDAEIVLTSSFHGTAFAVNYGKPVFSIVRDNNSGDSRQISLMNTLGLEDRVLNTGTSFPQYALASYNVEEEQRRLNILREESISYLRKAFFNESYPTMQ